MSRYIEENDVIRIVDENRDPVWHANTNYESTLYDISVAPSIDIIRCGECKWRNAKMMPKSVKCLFSGKADDYCSYGEREGER